jgi:hypothetical protein
MILNYAGIGIAMLTLIENTVSVTIRHSDNEPIASAAATASISRDEATGAEWPAKPPAPDDRVMAEFLRCASESLATQQGLAAIAGNIAAAAPQKWQNDGRFVVVTVIPAIHASATSPAGWSITASGRQSMATKPRVCSIRRNQARIAGNVARS